MTDYIKAVKRGLRDQCGIKPTGGTNDEPLFDSIPDGDYPVTIEGRMDTIRITAGKVSCCNFGSNLAARAIAAKKSE